MADMALPFRMSLTFMGSWSWLVTARPSEWESIGEEIIDKTAMSNHTVTYGIS